MAVLYQKDYTLIVGSALSHLECPQCGRRYEADQLQTICPVCDSPLLSRYDIDHLKKTFTPEIASGRQRGMWRWAELLPVREAHHRLTLGEGDTPLIAAAHLSADLDLPALWIKDESSNPTGTFKARGLAAAVARALELGVRDFVIPTAGNAGGALAAYAARARVPAHVIMPKDAPLANQVEVKAFGADLILVDGSISDAGKRAAGLASEHGWFNVSTFKEPYRVEGKKTMGLELAEEMKWELPDVIFYPTGGGTGLVGMWKAFSELECLGWLGDRRPRMVSVQAAGCAPIVRAFQTQAERAEFWQDAATLATGLRVPGPYADRLILACLRESNGTALTVTDEEILSAQDEMARREGILAAPEGAACLAGLRHLLKQKWIRRDERVVLFNTGSGLKYLT